MSWDEEETTAEVAAATIEAQEIKLFGKWNPCDVQVSDISLTVSPVDSSRNNKQVS